MYINVRIEKLYRAERSGSCKLGRYIRLSVMVPSVSTSTWAAATTAATLTEAELRIVVRGQEEESAK